MTNLIKKVWDNYKYRFVPWVSLQMKDKYEDQDEREINKNKDTKNSPLKVHYVIENESNYFLPPEQLQLLLGKLLQGFVPCGNGNGALPLAEKEGGNICQRNQEVMTRELGFTVTRRESTLGPSVGSGVFVTGGSVKAGSLVALYPGTIYLPSDPLLLASLRNQFIFRCQDRLLIDGNNRGISKSIYKSCSMRDKFSMTIPCCDATWLTTMPVNPLNVGQFINNENPSNPHNIIYQECTLRIPDIFDIIRPELWQFLPNVWYNPCNNQLGIRIIPLVAVRDIAEDEELFSAYFTIVHK